MVPVFVPPSSSSSPLTQCVLLAFTELAPSRDDEGMKKIKREGWRDMTLRTGEEHLGYFVETHWKSRLYSWRLTLINQLKQLLLHFFVSAHERLKTSELSPWGSSHVFISSSYSLLKVQIYIKRVQQHSTKFYLFSLERI